MKSEINLNESPKMIKVSSEVHTDLLILKAKLGCTKIEHVIKELLAKVRQDEEVQNSDRQ